MRSRGAPVSPEVGGPSSCPVHVLLVDEDATSRGILAQQLSDKGFVVRGEGDAEAGVQALRESRPDVVLVDRRLRGRGGVPALEEFKKIAPRIPVIVLTGHTGLDRPSTNGRVEAFAYVEKPAEPKALTSAIEAALRHRQQEVSEQPRVEPRSWGRRLWGRNGFRPGVLVVGLLALLAIASAPVPAGLAQTLSTPRHEHAARDPIAPYPAYPSLRTGESISDFRARLAGRDDAASTGTASVSEAASRRASRSAMAMLGILSMALLFWATRALPAGATGMIIALLLYGFGVFPPEAVASAFVGDPILLLASVLALAAAAATTGLDRRLGLAVLRTARSPWTFAFVGLPMLAVASSFLPGWAMVAFAVPVLAALGRETPQAAASQGRSPLAAGCVLALCFAANLGAAGSPAGSGRNAALLAILGDARIMVGFAQWCRLALPLVVVASFAVGAYWLAVLRSRGTSWGKALPPLARSALTRCGPLTKREATMVVTLLAVLALWLVQGSGTALAGWGLAGPALLGVAVLAATKILDAESLARVPWGTVVSFAGACAIAKGLGGTGVATWLGTVVAAWLPSSVGAGYGFLLLVAVVAVALATTLGELATVVLVGTIAVAVATTAGTDAWHALLATAFAASLANLVAVASPANAVSSVLAKDANTGAPLIRARDFLIHGTAVTLISLIAVSGWIWAGHRGWTPW